MSKDGVITSSMPLLVLFPMVSDYLSLFSPTSLRLLSKPNISPRECCISIKEFVEGTEEGFYVLSSATNHSKSHIKCTNVLSKAFLGLTAICWFCGCSVVPSHSFSPPAPAPRARPPYYTVFLLWSFKLLVLFSPRTTQLCSNPNRCKHPKVKEQADLEPADLEVLGFIPVPVGLHPSQ